MTAVLRTLARRIASIVAIVAGVLLAAVFAALALAATLAMGLALWIGNRFGLRATRPPRASGERTDRDVIDVEMREVEPGGQTGQPRTSGEEGKRAEH